MLHQEAAPNDRVMTSDEVEMIPIEAQEAILRDLIKNLEGVNEEMSAQASSHLRELIAKKGFMQYLARIADPIERQEAFERSLTEGFPDAVLQTLTPKDALFVEGPNTKQ